MAENKTKPDDRKDVKAFLESIEDPQKREDALQLVEIFQQTTGHPPVMWGDTMVGFGTYHYRYATGREGDSFLAGFSPRKANLTLYIMGGADQFPALMEKLGKYKTGKSCIYVKKLTDINLDVLRELVKESNAHLKTIYPQE